MQAVTGISEPDYGVVFDDAVWENGAAVPFDRFSNVRIEVELAFVLAAPLEGPRCSVFDVLRATEFVTPALEVLNAHIEFEGRTIVDTIADNASCGGVVLGGNPTRPDAVDLRWISAALPQPEHRGDRGRRRSAQPSGNGRRVVGEQVAPARRQDRSGGAGARRFVHATHMDLARRQRPVRLRRNGDDLLSVRVTTGDVLRDVLGATSRPLVGMWVCSGSSLVAEICAGGGLDWLLIDMEHAPSGLESVLAQLQAVAAYPVAPVVRVPSADPVVIKQVLDLGAQNLLVPMVSSADEAESVVAATRYPPRGRRGVGSALARSARWNRVGAYLTNADAHVSVFVQIETAEAVDAAAEIATVDGVDGVFVGPSDLAASLGLLGQQTHPEVTAAVERAFAGVLSTGTPVGVNAFDPAVADEYVAAGASFVLVGADVALLARGSESLAVRFIGTGA